MPENGIDISNKYIRLMIGICTLLTIISGIILFFISTKVNNAMSPFVSQLEAQENKLDNHIKESEKCLNGFSSKIFDVTIANIDETIKAMKKSQEKIDEA